MKPIELTDEHEDKLLKMCKVLFPEYKKIYWSTGKGSNNSSEHIGFGTKEENGFIDYIYIHWFEFCINNLLSKLRLTYYNYVRSNMEEGYNHLVDYLYEKFLKLK